MGLFDSIGQQPAAPASGGNKSVDIVFPSLPDTFEQFAALPQAALSTPFETAAMTVLALCFYPQNAELSMRMYELISGPRTINPAEKQFIKDRFRDKDYVPRSYFKGAVPQNDYKPSAPYTVTVNENPYSYQNEGYAKLYIPSGGSDNPRPVTLRKAKDGKWYLWEQFILVDVRPPESSNPWA